MAERGESVRSSGQSLARWAILLALGGAIALPYTARNAADAQRSAAAAAAASSSPASGAATASTRNDNETPHTDALTLLGDFIGVDASESAILNDSARAAVAVAGGLTPAATIEEARAALIHLKNSGDAPTAQNVSAKLREIIADQRRRAPQEPPALPTTAPVRIGSDGQSEDLAQQVAAFVNGSSEALRARVVEERFAERGIAVEFLVATVPDPIDSNARWTFDPIVTAIQQAAAASGYVLDRFYIPDWDPDRDEASAHVSTPRRTHERWPAVVLFRRDPAPDSGDRRRVLVASLVSETPTAGIHQDAFARAVRIQDAWRRLDDSDSEIRVMGPTFSGAAPSLKSAIDQLDPKPKRIRIVSGAATGVDPRSFEVDTRSAISFKTTVLPDAFTTWATIRFLRETDPDLRSDRLALLRESNTTYGNTVASHGRTLTVAARQRLQAAATSWWSPANWLRREDPQCPDYDSSCIFASAWMFPFPLHISRLRSAADADARRAAAAAGTPRFQTLQLDQPGSATDQIPALSPGSTAASVELILANIMDALNREHIGTVGLLATDARDKLFLAEQMARRNGGMRLFTLESDLLYVHPDYNRYMRGMIVASTYPLFTQTQRWYPTWHAAGAGQAPTRTSNQLQFSMTNAEGVYNATLALLDYDADGAPNGADVPPPVDYPFELTATHTFYPQLWMSVAGTDAIWPIDVVTPDEEDDTRQGNRGGGTAGVDPTTGVFAHLQPFKAAPAPHMSSTRGLAIDASPWSGLVFILFSVVVAVHVAFYQWPGAMPPQTAFARFFMRPRSASTARYLLAAFATLALAYGVIVFVLVADGWQGLRLSLFSLSATVSGVVLIGALLWTTLHLVAEVVAALPALQWPGTDRLKAAGPAAILGGTAALIAGGAAVIAFVYGAAYAIAQARWYTPGRWASATAYFHRATHPSNGVSPLVPIEFLLIAIYLWTFAHLWRLTRVPPAQLDEALQLFDGLQPHTPRYADARVKLSAFLVHPAHNLRLELAGVMLFVVVSTTAVTLGTRVVSPEPAAFTWSFNGWWVCVQVLLCLGLAETLTFWLRLRAVIRAVADSPLLGAFERLSPALLHDRLAPRQPQAADLSQAARAGRQLGLQLQALARDAAADSLLACTPPTPADIAACRLWPDTESWQSIARATRETLAAVAAFWAAKPRANTLATIDVDVRVDGITDDIQRWYLRAEEFVAMQVVFIVRELIARLATVFFYIIAAVLLLVAAQQSFPFEPHQQLLGTAWIYVLVAVALVFGVYVQMERDPLLSAISSTPAGRIRWDATIWSKVFLYGVIPLASIFAAQFPQIGTTLLDWLSPVQKALP
jgi:hypothetical protein